jgi:hypothetical protein
MSYAVRKAPGNIIPPFFDIEHNDRPGCVARIFASETAEGDARMLAAAPELLSLAIQYRDDLRFPPEPGSVERRLKAIADVLAKVTGASNG